jgi:hypothetical protein
MDTIVLKEKLSVAVVIKGVKLVLETVLCAHLALRWRIESNCLDWMDLVVV